MLTFSVAVLPGAMLAVLTGPDGVSTVSAWVTAPVFLTVTVIAPVLATFGLAGVILNSDSLSVSAVAPPDAAGAAELVVLAAAAVEEPDEADDDDDDDEPQPAMTAATTKGAMSVIRFMVSPVLAFSPQGRPEAIKRSR